MENRSNQYPDKLMIRHFKVQDTEHSAIISPVDFNNAQYEIELYYKLERCEGKPNRKQRRYIFEAAGKDIISLPVFYATLKALGQQKHEAYEKTLIESVQDRLREMLIQNGVVSFGTQMLRDTHHYLTSVSHDLTDPTSRLIELTNIEPFQHSPSKVNDEYLSALFGDSPREAERILEDFMKNEIQLQPIESCATQQILAIEQQGYEGKPRRSCIVHSSWFNHAPFMVGHVRNLDDSAPEASIEDKASGSYKPHVCTYFID